MALANPQNILLGKGLQKEGTDSYGKQIKKKEAAAFEAISSRARTIKLGEAEKMLRHPDKTLLSRRKMPDQKTKGGKRRATESHIRLRAKTSGAGGRR